MKLLLKQILKTKRASIFWILIITFFFIFDNIQGALIARVISCILTSFNYLLVLYTFSLFIFPKFWKKNKLYLVSSSIISLLLYWSISYLIYIKIIPFFGGTSYYQINTLSFFLVDSIFLFFVFAISGTSLFFHRYSINKLKNQVLKEKELLTKELYFLKDQFNSHLMFNFLNFCYSRIHKQSTNVAEAIEIFSDMLTYTLKTKSEEKVPILQEIQYIQNFISLQKIINPNTFIKLYSEINDESFKVMPMIVSSLVENAFKNGVNNESQSPIILNITNLNNKLGIQLKTKISNTLEFKNELNDLVKLIGSYYEDKFILKNESLDNTQEITITLEE
jgi:sensor histidine kinase YesM